MKTDIDIEDEIYQLISCSALAQEVTGRIVRDGKRNANSQVEDIVISILANVNGQNQVATINVNIYVKDKKKTISTNGIVSEQYTKNVSRLRELCTAAESLFANTNLNLKIDEQRVYDAEETHERVINTKLVYKLNNQ